ncbi:phage tail protein [Zemynaea arenosa]|nr:tail fiber protein [Massilia arenosa]
MRFFAHTVARRFALHSMIAGALAAASAVPLPAAAQAEPFIGQISCFPYNFVPRGWAALNGQLLSIAQNTALFALIGTTYGGNGQTTFALPDMRGRVMLSSGQGPGLAPRTIGEMSGTENTTITTANMPAHQHMVAPAASNSDATSISPAGLVPAAKSRTPLYTDAANSPTTMAATPSSIVGGSQPVSNMPPYLVMTCAIALEGIFPSRD